MIFFLFHIEIVGKGGWIIGGAIGYVGPPLRLLGGPGPPLPTPMQIKFQRSPLHHFLSYITTKSVA